MKHTHDGKKVTIKPLLAKVKTFKIDIECPYCGELIPNHEGELSHSAYEEIQEYLKCECGLTSRVPRKWTTKK